MTASCFLDTNILVYAAIGHRSDPEKYERALAILEAEDFATSAQVLQEFYVNVTRKADLPLTPQKGAEWVATLTRKPCQDVDAAIVMRGIENAQRFQLSYWDGAIIAAAQRLGTPTLYSEDLNHGQLYGAVRVVNPFRAH